VTVGYAQNEHGDKSIQLPIQMKQTNMTPNLSTIVSVLPTCAHFATLQKGKEIHNYTIRNVLDLNIFIDNALIHVCQMWEFRDCT
jgi:hypothetical protein